MFGVAVVAGFADPYFWFHAPNMDKNTTIRFSVSNSLHIAYICIIPDEGPLLETSNLFFCSLLMLISATHTGHALKFVYLRCNASDLYKPGFKLKHGNIANPVE